MAEMTKVFFLSYLRSEASRHVLCFHNGRQVRSGRGLAFWFLPWGTSLAEVPVDDRELTLQIQGRTSDFQEVSVQGTVFWRLADPDQVAQRVDFSLDLRTGKWQQQPMEQLTNLLSELAQQRAGAWLTEQPLAHVLGEGVPQLLQVLEAHLQDAPQLAELGVKVLAVSLRAVRPTPEVERALQTTTREKIQQEADRATFERRALAVERERAISENELNNKIQLARREEQLITQRGQNERRRLSEEAEAIRLKAEAEALRTRVQAEAEAEAARVAGAARVEEESARVAIYQGLPSEVLFGLAAREMAVHLPKIEHLSLTPDLLSQALGRLAGRS